MYGERDRVVKLRVSTDELDPWTAAATKRDAAARERYGTWIRAEGISGLIRAAVETAMKNGHVAGRGHKARPRRRARRGHKARSRRVATKTRSSTRRRRTRAH